MKNKYKWKKIPNPLAGRGIFCYNQIKGKKWKINQQTRDDKEGENCFRRYIVEEFGELMVFWYR